MKTKAIIKTVIVVLLLATLSNFGTVVHVVGESMEPTLRDDTYSIAVSYRNLERDDIVVIDSNKAHLIIKRIIALGGEHLVINEKGTFINDEQIIDMFHDVTNYVDIHVPKDSVFVLGDNREISKDSRFIGPVKINDIKYKLLIPKAYSKFTHRFIVLLLVIFYFGMIGKDLEIFYNRKGGNK